MDYKAVLFDFDYTIGDATDAIVAGYNGALERMGYPATDVETIRNTVGYPVGTGYTMITGDTSKEKIEEFVGHFRAIANPIQIREAKLFPGGREVIERLVEEKIPCGIVSSKPAFTLVPICERLGLVPILSVLIGGEMVTKSKPDPEGLLVAAEKLGMDPGDILYCGDTIMDAGAAQAAGYHFCAVLNGTTKADEFEAYPYDHIAPNLKDLYAYLFGEQLDG